MFPTIDFSNLGVAVGIGAVLKTIVGAIVQATNWLSQKVIAVMAGSKIWATAAFVGVSVILIGYLSSFIADVATFLVGLTIGKLASLNDFNWEFSVVNQALPFVKVGDIIFWSFGFVSSVLAVEVNFLFFRKAFAQFLALTSAFKN